MSTVSILIAEDERIAAEDLKIRLESLKYRVTDIVASGEKAVEKVGVSHPHLILMDVKLQGSMDGIDAAQAIRDQYETPVVFVTAFADRTTINRIKKTEPYGYIVKPYEDNELEGVIETALYKHRMELKLKESEERFRSLYENTTIGLYRTTPDGRILMANPALLKILGYSKFENLVKRNLEAEGFEPNYSRKEFKEEMKKKGQVIGLEAAWKRKDGSIVFIRESAKSFRDGKGNVLYYEGTVEDITKQKQVEIELRQSRELFHSVIDSLPYSVFSKDLDGYFTYVNHKFCETEDVKLDDVVGKTDFDLYPKNLAEKYRKTDQKVINQEKQIELVEEHQRKKGEKYQVKVIKTPLYNKLRRVSGVIGIFWNLENSDQDYL